MIHIRFFAKYREWMQLSDISLDATPVTLAELKQLILESFPNSLKVFDDPRCIIAVNQAVAQSGIELQSGDEVAFYPPVTGG